MGSKLQEQSAPGTGNNHDLVEDELNSCVVKSQIEPMSGNKPSDQHDESMDVCMNEDGNVQEIGSSKESEPKEDVKVINSDVSETILPNIEETYDFNFISVAECTKWFSEHRVIMKGCKWSPDGSCVLVASDDSTLRIFDFPSSFYNLTDVDNSGTPVIELSPSLKIVEAGQIYDYVWYPFMSSWDPATACFLSSASNCPVHLWDAFTGSIRASYRPYDYADEVTSSFSIAFGVRGDVIFVGVRNQVKLFDVSRPGRDCTTFNLKEIGRQKGMMSCIANCPTAENLFAVGSYRKTIGLYTTGGEYVCALSGQANGLTQLAFSRDGSLLFSAGRHDDAILCWDLRDPSDPLFAMKRQHTTNQRIYFDISPNGEYLFSGSTDGSVSIWNLEKASKESAVDSSVPCDFKFLAHKDCTNGVSVHPSKAILATASGQRHFPEVTSDDENPVTFSYDSIRQKFENSVKLWWFGAKKEATTFDSSK